MVVVPSGKFVMGSDERREEKPPHLVKIARPFSVGQYPVTAREWCARRQHCNAIEDDLPAVNVSWIEASDYVRWLNAPRKEAILPLPDGILTLHLRNPDHPTYRLLTEAEREYVTRAGTKTKYWVGDSISPRDANFGKMPSEFMPPLEPVQQYKANPFRLFQVHGNVLDWTSDCRNNNYHGAPNDGSSWGAGDCAFHPVRGGSWQADQSGLRSAARVFQYQYNRATCKTFGP